MNGTLAATVSDSSYAAGTVGFREAIDNTETALGGVTVTPRTDEPCLLADNFEGRPVPVDPAQLCRRGPPADPSTIDFGYSSGSILSVPVQAFADYYGRIASWHATVAVITLP